MATGTAAVAFAFLYEVTILDSRYAARQAELREDTATPAPGTRLRFTATGYCKGTTTASGVNVRTGIAAADPDLLPVGSVIQVDRLDEQYDGIYTIMDTGPKVQGRHIDIYMWSCNEALALRPPDGRHHRPAARLEPPRQHAPARRPPVPPARSRPADRGDGRDASGGTGLDTEVGSAGVNSQLRNSQLPNDWGLDGRTRRVGDVAQVRVGPTDGGDDHTTSTPT